MQVLICILSAVAAVLAATNTTDVLSPKEGDICNLINPYLPSTANHHVYFKCVRPTRNTDVWPWKHIGLWSKRQCPSGTAFSSAHLSCQDEKEVRQMQKRACSIWPETCLDQNTVESGRPVVADQQEVRLSDNAAVVLKPISWRANLANKHHKSSQDRRQQEDMTGPHSASVNHHNENQQPPLDAHLVAKPYIPNGISEPVIRPQHWEFEAQEKEQLKNGGLKPKMAESKLSSKFGFGPGSKREMKKKTVRRQNIPSQYGYQAGYSSSNYNPCVPPTCIPEPVQEYCPPECIPRPTPIPCRPPTCIPEPIPEQCPQICVEIQTPDPCPPECVPQPTAIPCRPPTCIPEPMPPQCPQACVQTPEPCPPECIPEPTPCVEPVCIPRPIPEQCPQTCVPPIDNTPRPCPVGGNGFCSWMMEKLRQAQAPNSFLQCVPVSGYCGQWMVRPCALGTRFDVRVQVCVHAHRPGKCGSGAAFLGRCNRQNQCPGRAVCEVQQQSCCQRNFR